jgi:hypothetical protein
MVIGCCVYLKCVFMHHIYKLYVVRLLENMILFVVYSRTLSVALFSWIEQPRRKTEESPPTSAEVKKTPHCGSGVDSVSNRTE